MEKLNRIQSTFCGACITDQPPQKKMLEPTILYSPKKQNKVSFILRSSEKKRKMNAISFEEIKYCQTEKKNKKVVCQDDSKIPKTQGIKNPFFEEKESSSSDLDEDIQVQRPAQSEAKQEIESCTEEQQKSIVHEIVQQAEKVISKTNFAVTQLMSERFKFLEEEPTDNLQKLI